MIIVDSCMIWFHFDCIMQLKKSYHIATNVCSRKSATTFGNLPDCSRNGWAWRHAIGYDSYDQLYWTKRLLYASYIGVSLHRHRCLVILNQSEAIRLFDLPISQTDRKGMAKLVIIGPLWGEFVSGRWSRLTKVSNILITDAIREISFSLVMDVFWTILYADRSHNQHILSTTR